jgi:hypothetical protein
LKRLVQKTVFGSARCAVPAQPVESLGVADRVGRAATQQDIPAVAACLASAFHEDPLWGHWTFPDAATRAVGLTRFMAFWAMTGVRWPWLRMTDGCEAVAAWVPPGEPDMTRDEERRYGVLLAELFGPRATELEALMGQFGENHPHEPPHYYLGWWATHRDHAGRGLGTVLLHDNLAQIDAEHMPAYLESTNPANLPRYEALGFARRTDFGPPGGPVITTMWREAR